MAIGSTMSWLGVQGRRKGSLGAALAAVLGCSSAAHADFVEYKIERIVADGLTKHVLYGVFSGPTDTVLSAQINIVDGDTVYFHADVLTESKASSIAGSWNPTMIWLTGLMDSYVCIGGGEGLLSGNATQGWADSWGFNWNQPQLPYFAYEGPFWFNGNPSNLQGRVDVDGRTKLGQFVLTAGAPKATLRLKVAYNDGQGGGIQFSEANFEIGCIGDCDDNGQCDELDIALDGAADCDGNLILDTCQLADGTATDCDANGLLDICDIASGTPDCDGDGLPDRCEGAASIDLVHEFAFSSAAAYEYTFTDLPPAYTGTPRLEIAATADLGSATDALVVALDGATGTTFFLGDGNDCPAAPDRATITRDLASFNALVADGALLVRLTAIGAVNTANCPEGGISIRLIYEGLPAANDCNANAVPDSCELDTGALADCDGDRVPDICQLAAGVEGDCNSNGTLDSCDLAAGLSTDLDGNGVLDDCPGEYVVGGAGFTTIQSAIDAAPEGAEILVAAGSYAPIDLSSRGITLRSIDGPASTSISGDGVQRCFSMQSAALGETVIDGFTFREGHADCGGCARITLASPRFLNCRFLDSTGFVHGGAIALHGAAATFADCQFSGNLGGMGGAVWTEGEPSTGVALFERCTFSENEAGSIGGAILNSGQIELRDCVVERNTSLIAGGGASFLSQGLARLAGTRFCLNSLGNIQGQFVDLGGNILSQDCDGDGLCDYDEVLDGTEPDCNANLVPDACEISGGSTADCNGNGVPDGCDIVAGTSGDVDANGTPDECQPDCDGDGLPDSYEIAEGAADCNANGIPDSCDLAAGASTDLDGNGVLDECSGEFVVGGSGYATVQAAIDAAPQGATVLVSAGSYGRLDLTGRAISLRSLDGAAVTVIDGTGTDRCFSMQGEGPGETIVEGFTFRNGFADCGGAVRVTLSSPRFVECVFTGNVGTLHGGAVALHGTAAEFIGCDFLGNGAGLGGAIWIEGEPSTGVALFDGCVFEGNEAGSIGGAILNSGQLELRDCVIERNTSLIAGGGASFLSQGQAWVGGTRFCLNSLGNVQGQYIDLGGNILSQDCDGDGVCDFDEIASGDEADCDLNGRPDACDLAAGVADCNENGVPDRCDIDSGASNDVDSNGVPDECKPDCDGDGVPDGWELANGLDSDCDDDGTIDSCQIAAGAEDDDADGRLDACEYAQGDLNLDGIVNGADLSTLLSLWGFTTPPVGDLNGDGTVGAADLAIVLGNWGPLP